MKKWMCLLLGICTVAAVLAGCGEDDEKDKTSSTGSGVGTSSVAPVAVSPSPTPEQTAKAVKVKADDGLNVRSKASTDCEVYGLAKKGSKLALLVEDPKDGWYQVSYNGKTAFVSADYVEVAEVTLDEYNKLKAEAGKDSASTSSKDEEDEASSKPGNGEDPQSGGDDEDGE